MNEDENLTSAQPRLTSAEQRVADFEIRMNYKAQPLSEEEQERLDTKFHNALRLRRWVE